MMETGNAIIVVGVDGGRQGEAALRFAAGEAERCGDTIELVTAFTAAPWPVSPSGVADGVSNLEQLRAVARQNQRFSVQLVLGENPTVRLISRVEHGEAGPVLVEAARRARVLVVGSHGYGPVRAAVLGSVSRYCAQHATCPVVVVPSLERSSAEAGADADAGAGQRGARAST